jgi:hypothetical protein
MGLKIVYGPPLSGKSTYVREHIGKNDIVYDYDEITRAITYGKEHLSVRDTSHQYVIDIRLALIKRYRLCSDVKKFWIISTFLTDSFKEFIKDLKPEYIKMDVSLEECLDRLEKDDMRPDKEQWKKKIHEWFDKNGEKRGRSYSTQKRYVNPYRIL